MCRGQLTVPPGELSTSLNVAGQTSRVYLSMVAADPDLKQLQVARP